MGGKIPSGGCLGRSAGRAVKDKKQERRENFSDEKDQYFNSLLQ